MADIDQNTAEIPPRAGRNGGRRQRVIYGAKVAHADGNYCTRCTITNLSSGGAKIRLPLFSAIPDTVLLLDQRNRMAYAANVVWRKSPEFGLEFSAKYSYDALPSPELARLVNGQSEPEGQSLGGGVAAVEAEGDAI